MATGQLLPARLTTRRREVLVEHSGQRLHRDIHLHERAAKLPYGGPPIAVRTAGPQGGGAT